MERDQVLAGMLKLQEFTAQDLAGLTGVNLATVRSNIRRDRQLLHESGSVETGRRGGKFKRYQLTEQGAAEFRQHLQALERITVSALGPDDAWQTWLVAEDNLLRFVTTVSGELKKAFVEASLEDATSLLGQPPKQASAVRQRSLAWLVMLTEAERDGVKPGRDLLKDWTRLMTALMQAGRLEPSLHGLLGAHMERVQGSPLFGGERFTSLFAPSLSGRVVVVRSPQTDKIVKRVKDEFVRCNLDFDVRSAKDLPSRQPDAFVVTLATHEDRYGDVEGIRAFLDDFRSRLQVTYNTVAPMGEIVVLGDVYRAAANRVSREQSARFVPLDDVSPGGVVDAIFETESRARVLRRTIGLDDADSLGEVGNLLTQSASA